VQKENPKGVALQLRVPEKAIARLEPHDGEVQGLVFSPDNKKVASFYRRKPTRLWDAGTGKLIRELEFALALEQRFDLGYLGRGKILAATFRHMPTQNELFQISEAGQWENIGQDQPEMTWYPNCMPDDDSVPVVYYQTKKAFIGFWAISKRFVSRSFEANGNAAVDLVLSSDRKKIAALVNDFDNELCIIVYDVATGRKLRRLPAPPTFGWPRFAFSANDKSLITGPHSVQPGTPSFFEHWDLTADNARVIVQCENEYIPRNRKRLTAFHFLGERLAAFGRDSTIHLVDPSNGKDIGKLKGHEEDITCLAVSLDKRYLASGGDDKYVLIWDLEALGQARNR